MTRPSANAASEFILETRERTQRVGTNLLLIEKGSASKEVVDELYRDMHTIKGNAQLFGYHQIGKIAHSMETCLDPIRRHAIIPSPELVDAINNCLNLLEEILKAVEKQGGESDFQDQITFLISKLTEVATENFTEIKALEKDLIISDFDGGPETSITLPTKNESEKRDVNAQEKNKKVPKEIAPVENSNPEKVPTTNDAGTTLRVNVGILDRLMNLIGEMVLVRNQVLQYSDTIDDMSFLQMSQRLDLVTSELQAEVMKTRMQPIGNILDPFQRVVRDLSRELNKKINLTIEGRETELDKTLLESIKDPLTHIVRNAVDHGIESLEGRQKSGKNEIGQIAIRSYHEGGQVIIEIKDDGKGLNRDAIIKKAIERGLVKPERASSMNERDIYNIIFLPGFSTAENVTTVSGRGVGMDVVKTNVEKIGGNVEIISELGNGTMIRLRIPLTLAIIPALLVKCGSERFAIPQVKLVELVRVEKDNQGTKIEFLQGKPMYRLRGELLPLVELREVLRFNDEKAGEKQDLRSKDVVSIVVLNADGLQFGLVVDEIQDTADIVVKPLTNFLKKISVYSGATIMGDGSVAIILDVVGITQWEKLSNRREQDETVNQVRSSAELSHEIQEFLLFKLESPGKYSLPLSLVQRLEEFDAKAIEFTGAQAVVRYRNSILPIISLNAALGFDTKGDFKKDKISIIVLQKHGRPYGVLVNEILDVESVVTEVNTSVKDRAGILGNMIVNNEVVVVLDILNIIDEQAKKLGVEVKSETNHGSIKNRAGYHILLAEDTSFFKKVIRNYLESAGFKVTVASDGAEALELVKSNNFTALVSDIEMPKVNGFELAAHLKTNDAWKSKPLIAVTTRFNDRDVQHGKEVGFNAYLEKFNGDLLIKELDQLIKKSGAGL